MRSCFFLLLILCAVTSHAQQDKIAIVTSLEKQVTDQFRRGRFEASLQLTDSILKYAPANFDYLRFGYETCLADLHDTARAVRYLEKIVAFHPYESEYLDQYTWVLLKNKDLKKARSFAEKAYSIDRDNLSILVNYAHVLNASGEKEPAILVYAEADQLTYSKAKYERLQKQDFALLDSIYPGFAAIASVTEHGFEKAVSAYAEANRFALLIDSLEIIGIPEANMASHYHRALVAELSTQPQRGKNISRYYNSLAFYHHHKNNIDSAAWYFRSALAFDMAANNYPAAARRNENLGNIYRGAGLMDSIVHYYSEAEKYFAVTGNRMGIVNAQLNISTALATGRSDIQAYRLIQDSILPAMEDLNDHERLAVVYEFVAADHAARGAADSQLLFLEKAIMVNRLNSLPERSLINVYRSMGHLYMSQNQLSTAEQYFGKAAEQIAYTERKGLTGFYSKWDQGTLYFKRGEWEKAKAALNEGIDILFAQRNAIDLKLKQDIAGHRESVFIVLSEVCKKLEDAGGASRALELSRSFLLN